MRKIEAHGIAGDVLNWIKNWLDGRRQKVCINKDFSTWAMVTSGVPQESVLGPILSSIYINDLDSDLISKICKFAGDTKMCKNVGKPEGVISLQDDLNKLYNWSLEWQMQFNVDKCSVIHVGHRNLNNTYKLGNRELKFSE